MLDDIGWHILEILQEDARLSYAEIGRRVGLTPPAVAERVQKMESAGVIRGYRAVVDPAQIGLPIQTFVHLQVERAQFREVIEVLRGFDEVLECHRATGSSSLIVRVAVSSIAHMERLLDRLLRYGEPVSSVILSTPIQRRVFRRPS